VAVGQARQLVLARDDDRRRQVAGFRPIDGRGDRPQGGRQVGGQEVRKQDPRDGRDHEDEQQHTAERGALARSWIEDQEEDPERAERHDRCGDEADGEARPERQVQAEPAAIRVVITTALVEQVVKLVGGQISAAPLLGARSAASSGGSR